MQTLTFTPSFNHVSPPYISRSGGLWETYPPHGLRSRIFIHSLRNRRGRLFLRSHLSISSMTEATSLTESFELLWRVIRALTPSILKSSDLLRTVTTSLEFSKPSPLFQTLYLSWILLVFPNLKGGM